MTDAEVFNTLRGMLQALDTQRTSAIGLNSVLLLIGSVLLTQSGDEQVLSIRALHLAMTLNFLAILFLFFMLWVHFAKGKIADRDGKNLSDEINHLNTIIKRRTAMFRCGWLMTALSLVVVGCSLVYSISVSL